MVLLFATVEEIPMSSAAALQPSTIGEVFQCLAVLFAEMIARMVGALLEVRAGLPRWHPMRMVISAEVAGLRALGRKVAAHIETQVALMEAEDAEALALGDVAGSAEP